MGKNIWKMEDLVRAYVQEREMSEREAFHHLNCVVMCDLMYGESIDRNFVDFQSHHAFFRPLSLDWWNPDTQNRTTLSTPCFAVSRFDDVVYGSFVIVAIRGSVSEADWKANLDCFSGTEHNRHGLQIHSGYHHRGEMVPLRAIFEKFNASGIQFDAFLVTGHSLGGATAELAVVHSGLGNKVRCVTFGQPCTGTIAETQRNIQCVQFFHVKDPVPVILFYKGFQYNRNSSYYLIRIEDNTQRFHSHTAATIMKNMPRTIFQFFFRSGMCLQAHQTYRQSFLKHVKREGAAPIVETLPPRLFGNVQHGIIYAESVQIYRGRPTLELNIQVTDTNRYRMCAVCFDINEIRPPRAHHRPILCYGSISLPHESENGLFWRVRFTLPATAKLTASNYHFHIFDGFQVTSHDVKLKFQCIWFIGLRGSGKSSLVNAIFSVLKNNGRIIQNDPAFDAKAFNQVQNADMHNFEKYYQQYHFQEILGVLNDRNEPINLNCVADPRERQKLELVPPEQRLEALLKMEYEKYRPRKVCFILPVNELNAGTSPHSNIIEACKILDDLVRRSEHIVDYHLVLTKYNCAVEQHISNFVMAFDREIANGHRFWNNYDLERVYRVNSIHVLKEWWFGSYKTADISGVDKLVEDLTESQNY